MGLFHFHKTQKHVALLVLRFLILLLQTQISFKKFITKKNDFESKKKEYFLDSMW